MIVVVLGAVAVACSGSEPPTGDVQPASALTAIVEWQAAESPPIVDANGTTHLPVIYVVPASGDTIDVGVQAQVAASTADVASVRFADDSRDVFDAGIEGQPVIDDGVMLLVGSMPPPAPSIDVGLIRYTSVDTSEPIQLQITADDDASTTGTATATVTSATQP
jgi:hypothetical protein